MAEYIDTPQALSAMCKHIKGCEALALDTEFIGEHTYYPKLALIQIADDETIWLIDPVAITDLKPLGKILSDPKTTIIVHDGETDLTIMTRRCGATMPSLFDSQLAAAFVGMPEHVGLYSLVHKITGRRLTKGQQVTDWLRRPLSKKQLSYAANDVRYLVAVYRELKSQLNQSGRVRYYDEEMARIRSRWESPIDLETRFKKMFANHRLTVRKHDALMGLLTWREQTAIARDIPRRHVLQDDAIVRLADNLPVRIEDIKAQRMISDRAVKRYGKELIGLCEQYRALPETLVPRDKSERPIRHGAGVKTRAPIVKMAMEALAAEAGIAPGLIARADDVRDLCHAASNGKNKQPDLPCMSGWRYELVGQKLWQFARGEASLRVGPDPHGPAVLLETVVNAAKSKSKKK